MWTYRVRHSTPGRNNDQVHQRYYKPTGGYALIRPDGYIAVIENDGRTADLRHYIGQTLM